MKYSGNAIQFPDGTYHTTSKGGIECTVSGTENAITLTTGISLTSIPTGQLFRFTTTTRNTATITSITIDGIVVPAKTVTGVDLPTDYIRDDVENVFTISTTGDAIVTPPNYWMLGGAGQSWQVVTGSRALDTLYTNDTDRPIEVYVRVLTSTSDIGNRTGVQIIIDGSIMIASDIYPVASGNVQYFSISASVPSGSTYSASDPVEGTSTTLHTWSELR